jgi:hypothetical protein
MDTFDDLSDNYKKELFDDSVQAYVEYPEELNKKGKKVVMKTISNAWRTYKSRLVNCLRNEENPFDKFKDLTQEHWERFVTKCKSDEFVKGNEYMRWLQSHNDLTHHLGSIKYARKQRQWE